MSSNGGRAARFAPAKYNAGRRSPRQVVPASVPGALPLGPALAYQPLLSASHPRAAHSAWSPGRWGCRCSAPAQRCGTRSCGSARRRRRAQTWRHAAALTGHTRRGLPLAAGGGGAGACHMALCNLRTASCGSAVVFATHCRDAGCKAIQRDGRGQAEQAVEGHLTVEACSTWWAADRSPASKLLTSTALAPLRTSSTFVMLKKRKATYRGGSWSPWYRSAQGR